MLNFSVYGESHDGCTLALCGSCHETLHIGLAAIIHKRKRATQLWEALVSALGQNSQFIRAIEDKVYETAELTIDMHINCNDYNGYEELEST